MANFLTVLALIFWKYEQSHICIEYHGQREEKNCIGIWCSQGFDFTVLCVCVSRDILSGKKKKETKMGQAWSVFSKKPGPSGFGANSTAEFVTANIDLHSKTAMVTGKFFGYVCLIIIPSVSVVGNKVCCSLLLIWTSRTQGTTRSSITLSKQRVSPMYRKNCNLVQDNEIWSMCVVVVV